MKNCSNKNCKQLNPQVSENFKLRSNGSLKSWCKQCDAQYSKEWKKLNESKVKAWSKKSVANWRNNNPDAAKGLNLRKYWPNLSGLEAFQEYSKLAETQNHKCSICEKHQSELKYSLCVDHCHITGKIRGLLCDNCNQALGLLKDNIDALKRAIKYLT